MPDCWRWRVPAAWAWVLVARPLVAQADTVPVALSARASAFVLSSVTEPVDPFFHASALLHAVVTARLGTNVTVPVRVVSEVWNFSDSYSRPTETSVRPAVRVALRRGASGDSLVLLAGDLWRVRHGAGLVLDDFESQGAFVGAYTGRWALTGNVIGWGWTGFDGLFTAGAAYDNRIAVRFLENAPDVPGFVGTRLLSADGRVPIPLGAELYSEVSRNVDAARWAALLGVRRAPGQGRQRLTWTVEYRHYDGGFFPSDTSITPALLYRYHVSLTSFDKPVNSFHLYQARLGRHDVVAARLQARAYWGDWFVDADVEGITGTVDELAYDVGVGFAANPLVHLSTGVLNKFFQFPGAASGMFLIRDTPWWFAKVTVGPVAVH